jgi:hypothetical protein
MASIHFKTEIVPGQAIALPKDVIVPIGPAEVIIIPQAESPPKDESQVIPRVPQIALDLARFAEENGPTNLPSDYAINHDHYLHGAPKWIDLE